MSGLGRAARDAHANLSSLLTNDSRERAVPVQSDASTTATPAKTPIRTSATRVGAVARANMASNVAARRAVGLTRWMSRILVGVSATDPMTYLAIAALFVRLPPLPAGY